MRRLTVPSRRLQEMLPPREGLFRAKLGEDYDGIGQYVLVSLASSAVGGAYKARVAAGDFGGLRTFPRGTPVTVFSYRGQLEVFLGNIPSVCTSLDDFERVAVDQWGLATIGSIWAQFPEGAAQGQPSECFQVAGGLGSIAFSSTTGGVQRMSMGSVSVNTEDWPWMDVAYKMKMRLKFTGLSLLSSGYPELIIRPRTQIPGPFVPSERLSINPTNLFEESFVAINTITDLDFDLSVVWANDTFYSLIYERSATEVRAKFFLDTDSEPSEWLVSAPTADNSYLSSRFQIEFTHDTNQNAVLWIDNIEFCPP